MTASESNPVIDEALTTCAVHPDRETTLKCNKCERYMCVQCAVQTPVGYRCRECIRGIESKFYTATEGDYARNFVICAGLTALGGAVVAYTGFPILFLLILGLPVGGFIGEMALRFTSRKRGRQSGNVAAAGAVIGGLVGGLLAHYLQFSSAINAAMAQMPVEQRQNMPSLDLNLLLTMTVSDISLLLFVGIVAFAVYGRYRMRS